MRHSFEDLILLFSLDKTFTNIKKYTSNINIINIKFLFSSRNEDVSLILTFHLAREKVKYDALITIININLFFIFIVFSFGKMADKIMNITKIPLMNIRKKILGNHALLASIDICLIIAKLASISPIVILMGFPLETTTIIVTAITYINIFLIILFSLFKVPVLGIGEFREISIEFYFSFYYIYFGLLIFFLFSVKIGFFAFFRRFNAIDYYGLYFFVSQQFLLRFCLLGF